MSVSSKVLIVDDDESIRTLLSRMLKIKGFEAILASSGNEALEKVSELPEELFVILDMNMPGISGEETLIKLHEMRPKWKIILSSGYGATLDMNYFTELGVYKFLNKPFNMNDLVSTLT